jgi:hypothetical protein
MPATTAGIFYAKRCWFHGLLKDIVARFESKRKE